MKASLNILLIQGSLRERSSTFVMLHDLQQRLAALGAEAVMLDLRKTELPLYNPDVAKKGDVYQHIRPLVAAADGFVLGSPDYHGGPSGVMKNFLDHFWGELAGKIFGYLCASHEKGLTVMDAIRVAVRQCYGWSLPYGISAVDGQDTGDVGDVRSETLRARLDMMAHDLVNYGTVIRDQRLADLAGNQPTFIARHR